VTAQQLGLYLGHINAATTVAQLAAIEADLVAEWAEDAESAGAILRLIARRQSTLARG
jgi:hypothetical protein